MHILYTTTSSPITLYNAAQLLVVRSNSVSAIHSTCANGMYFSFLSTNSPVTLYDASQVVVNGSNTMSVVNSTGKIMLLSILYRYTNSPVTLYNASRVVVDGSTVSVINHICSGIFMYLSILYIANSPLTLQDVSQLVVTGSTVSAVNSQSSGSGGTVSIGGLFVMKGTGIALMFVAGDARIVLDDVKVVAKFFKKSGAANGVFQAAVVLVEDSRDRLELYDRGAVLITRCAATVTNATFNTTLAALNSSPPLASIFSVPITTFRNSSTVRVCGSMAAVTDTTIGGAFYPGPYTSAPGATPGAELTVYGNTTILDACNASAKASGLRCGLDVSDDAGRGGCFPRALTTTATATHTRTVPVTDSIRRQSVSRSNSPTRDVTNSSSHGSISSSKSPTHPRTVAIPASNRTPSASGISRTTSASQSKSFSVTVTAATRNEKTATAAIHAATSTHTVVVPPTASDAAPAAPITGIPPAGETVLVAVAGTFAATVAVDMQAQSALTVSRCAAEAAGGGQVTSQSLRALSPFATADTCQGLLEGHAILFGVAVSVMGVAVAAVGAWKRCRAQPTRPMHVVLSAARCPSMLLAVGVFMLTGLIVCGGRGDDDEGGTAQQALALTFAVLLSAAGPVLAALFGTRRYVPYAAPPVPKSLRGSAVACVMGRLLLPQGMLQPLMAEEVSRPCTPSVEWSKILAAAIGAWRFPSPLLAFVPQLSALALVPALLASGAFCAPLHWVSASLFWVCSFLIAAVRPRRIFIGDMLHCAALAVNGAFVATVAANASGGAFARALAIVQIALTVLRVVHAVLLALLPRCRRRCARRLRGLGLRRRSSSPKMTTIAMLRTLCHGSLLGGGIAASQPQLALITDSVPARPVRCLRCRSHCSSTAPLVLTVMTTIPLCYHFGKNILFLRRFCRPSSTNEPILTVHRTRAISVLTTVRATLQNKNNNNNEINIYQCSLQSKSSRHTIETLTEVHNTRMRCTRDILRNRAARRLFGVQGPEPAQGHGPRARPTVSSDDRHMSKDTSSVDQSPAYV